MSCLFPEFLQNKKSRYICAARKMGIRIAMLYPQKFLRNRKYVTAFNESNCEKYVIQLSLKRGASQTYL